MHFQNLKHEIILISGIDIHHKRNHEDKLWCMSSLASDQIKRKRTIIKDKHKNMSKYQKRTQIIKSYG